MPDPLARHVAAGVKVPVAGSYSSTDAIGCRRRTTGCPVRTRGSCCPPAMSTRPSSRRVAVWFARATAIGSTVVNVPDRGIERLRVRERTVRRGVHAPDDEHRPVLEGRRGRVPSRGAHPDRVPVRLRDRVEQQGGPRVVGVAARDQDASIRQGRDGGTLQVGGVRVSDRSARRRRVAAGAAGRERPGGSRSPGPRPQQGAASRVRRRNDHVDDGRHSVGPVRVRARPRATRSPRAASARDRGHHRRHEAIGGRDARAGRSAVRMASSVRRASVIVVPSRADARARHGRATAAT